MFPAKEQLTSRLVLLVVIAALSNAVSIFIDTPPGDPNACAEVATAYAEWIGNEGKCLLAQNMRLSRS